MEGAIRCAEWAKERLSRIHISDRAMEVVRQATGSMPRRGSGSTDCNIPLSLGIPSVCVGCYRGEGAHTRSEYVEIDSLKQGYQVAFGMILG